MYIVLLPAVWVVNVFGNKKYVALSVDALYPVPVPPVPFVTAIEPSEPPLQLTFVIVNVAFGAVLDRFPTLTDVTVPVLLLFLT
jgi:hypothetical protein